MARFERLLLPIVALVIVGAILLEDAGPSTVRGIAIGLGVLLVLAIVIGMYHRAKKKLREGRREDEREQARRG